MQTTSDLHDQIGETVFSVAKHLAHNPTAFDARQHVLDLDADTSSLSERRLKQAGE